jgi:hypothetical protein
MEKHKRGRVTRQRFYTGVRDARDHDDDGNDHSRGSRPTRLEPQILYVIYNSLFQTTNIIFQELRDNKERMPIHPSRKTDDKCKRQMQTTNAIQRTNAHPPISKDRRQTQTTNASSRGNQKRKETAEGARDTSSPQYK